VQLSSGILKWQSAVSLSDIVAIIAFVVAAVTAILAYRQYRIIVVTNRARFALDFMQQWYANTKIREMYYRIDYEDWLFDPGSFPMSADEPAIDQILSMLDLVSHLLKLGILSRSELSIIKFEAIAVLENEEIQKYLKWLDSEGEKIGIAPGSTYIHLGELTSALREL
jgi:uncharacterized membrane protein (DUF441 family)